MNKDLKARVETTISTARHVFSNDFFVNRGNVDIDAGHIYLLEKIEELQAQIDEMKSKRKVKK